jgi:hypothetical protein
MTIELLLYFSIWLVTMVTVAILKILILDCKSTHCVKFHKVKANSLWEHVLQGSRCRSTMLQLKSAFGYFFGT